MTDSGREDLHRLKRMLVGGKTHAARKMAISLALLSLIVFTAVSGCLSIDAVADRHALSVTRTDAAGTEICTPLLMEGGATNTAPSFCRFRTAVCLSEGRSNNLREATSTPCCSRSRRTAGSSGTGRFRHGMALRQSSPT